MSCACIQHAVFVIHSLEAHWVSIPVADYAELRTREVNGPNANRRKASRMRSFRQLDKYIEHDSTDKERLVTIHLAIVCDEFVWILLDFSRLARIHVMSRGTYWTADDLKPGTPVRSVSYCRRLLLLIVCFRFGLRFSAESMGLTGITSARMRCVS